MKNHFPSTRLFLFASFMLALGALSACDGNSAPGSADQDAESGSQDAGLGDRDAGRDTGQETSKDAGKVTKPGKNDAGKGTEPRSTDAGNDTAPEAMPTVRPVTSCPANLGGSANPIANGSGLTYGIQVKTTVAVPLNSLTISGINMTGAGYIRANLYQSGSPTPFAAGAMTATAAGSGLSVVVPLSPTLTGSTPTLTPGVLYVIGIYVSGGTSTTAMSPSQLPCTVTYGEGNIVVESSLQSTLPGENYPDAPSQSTPQLQFNEATQAGEGSACTNDSMCGTGFCNTATLTCVAGQSCKGSYPYSSLGSDMMAGLDSCGSGESTDPTQAHESCCRSLLLPSTSSDAVPMRMDKYEVTSGRMRQFIEAMHAYGAQDNIQAWALAQVAASTTFPSVGYFLAQQMSPQTMAFLPTSADPSAELNTPVQLGATTMDSNVPSSEQGCWMGSGAYGASTYFQANSTLSGVGSPARSLQQAQYDIKSMNCGTYMMYAAFCAWDGGRLPTMSEVAEAWGPGQYPWGTATGLSAPFVPAAYPVTAPYSIGNSLGASATFANISATAGVTQTANWNNNSFLGFSGHFYMYPNGGSLLSDPIVGGTDLITSGTDLTAYIASPGRFQQDVTLVKSVSFSENEGWQDLAANMMEQTVAPTTPGNDIFCDCVTASSAEMATAIAQGIGSAVGNECACPGKKRGMVRSNTMPLSSWIGGSWEGHFAANALPATSLGFPWLSMHQPSYNFPLQTQYGKAGLRCVRPAQ